MRISLAQLNFHIGNFEGNKQQIISAIAKAKQNHADLVVFPELAISGYPPRDFLEFDHFIAQCKLSLEEIAKHCNTIAAIVGCPTVNSETKGKRLYNSACFLSEGEITEIRHKTLLPTYDVFDEYRYFEPNNTFKLLR